MIYIRAFIGNMRDKIFQTLVKDCFK